MVARKASSDLGTRQTLSGAAGETEEVASYKIERLSETIRKGKPVAWLRKINGGSGGI